MNYMDEQAFCYMTMQTMCYIRYFPMTDLFLDYFH
jgi:hypothetical protein